LYILVGSTGTPALWASSDTPRRIRVSDFLVPSGKTRIALPCLSIRIVLFIEDGSGAVLFTGYACTLLISHPKNGILKSSFLAMKYIGRFRHEPTRGGSAREL
jgi:hypothetical protein